jgi:integrase
MENIIKHYHKFEDYDNYIKCTICGKTLLKLEQTDKEGLRKGIMKSGHEYSVRNQRKRYFFPNEWNDFIKQIKNKKHKFFFIVLLHTGARVMETLNLKYEDIDMERQTVNFRVVKQRKAKKTFYASGTTRKFFVDEEFIKEYKSFIRGTIINPNEYIFLDNKKLPNNYDGLNNDEKKKYYISKVVAYASMFKRKVKLAGIKDYWNFSLHNIRKTYGNWMRTFNIDSAELCYRLGHDMNTYMAHYGSSLIFNQEERKQIEKIFAGVK